jgi:multicomponent K+:H+ antiporter subunit G
MHTIIAILLLIGGFFSFTASFGLIRLPDTLTRIHAPTKTVTLGIGALLLAVLLHHWLEGMPIPRGFLLIIFLWLTAPVTGHLIARASDDEDRKSKNNPYE